MSKKCPQCETSYLTNDYDDICHFCLIERNSYKEERICPRCLESFSVTIPLSAGKEFCNRPVCKSELEQNFQKLKKQIENINTDYSEIEFVDDLREELKQERFTWYNIDKEQYSKLMSLLSEKSGAIKTRDKKDDHEQKNAISWDNFLGVVEELKREPNLVLESLSEWEKMNSSDQELAKVVQKIIKEGEELKERLVDKKESESNKNRWKESFRQRVNRYLDSWKTNMSHIGISTKDKDLSVIDNLVNEICGEKSENNDYSNLSQKLARGEVVDNQSIDNLPPNQITDSEKERLKKTNQTNKQKSDLQKSISELENKPNLTPEEQKELDRIKTQLESLNNQSAQTQNNNQNPLLKPILIIGGAVILTGLILSLIFKKRKRK